MGTSLDLRLAPADAAAIEAVSDHARTNRWAERLFDRDTTLWSDDPATQAGIADRLGWLDAPNHFEGQIAALEGFGDGIRAAGFTTAVVMGMGGSSLAPEVLAKVVGRAEGYLDLRVLDSTDPAAVAAALDDLDPLSTLWIVASKSGTTTEPLAFLAEAWARVESALEAAYSPQRVGEFFVAITDPGRSRAAIPHHDELREVFLNPPDIGGRYSALTYVGLVPASLIGLDLDALLAAAATTLAACREPEPDANPGLSLGLALGALARRGRDKLTILADPELGAFGAWVEQLVAESSGKDGTGILPVDLEPVGVPAAYGPDRMFVRLRLAGIDGEVSAGHLDQLAGGLELLGHPVITITLDDPIDVGGEFVRWEVATAIACAVLGVDPFDQPNVEEAKERTREVLRSAAGGASAPTNGGNGAIRPVEAGEAAVTEAIRGLLDGATPGPNGPYLAIQAFVAPSAALDTSIARLRSLVRDATGLATTAGYGPRFLHSTGQLHKGGAPVGRFLQITADHLVDRVIPGWPYTFGRLIDAQAQGDREALAAHGVPVLRVHLGPDPERDLAILARAAEAALRG